MYRVIEVANMLNVSKVTIYKKMDLLKKELKPYIKKQRKITFIEAEGVEIIKKSLTYQKTDDLHLVELENKKLTDELARLQEIVDANKDSYGRAFTGQIGDLEKQIDLLGNQVRIKEGELATKDFILSELKQLIKNNRERIAYMDKITE